MGPTMPVGPLMPGYPGLPAAPRTPLLPVESEFNDKSDHVAVSLRHARHHGKSQLSALQTSLGFSLSTILLVSLLSLASVGRTNL